MNDPLAAESGLWRVKNWPFIAAFAAQ